MSKEVLPMADLHQIERQSKVMYDETFDQMNNDDSSIITLDSRVSWCVCICSCLANTIIEGSLLSYAILFPKILEEFQEGKARTVIVASLGLASYSVLSPVSAKLCIRFGCRVVTVGSGLTCALGLLGSSFAPNLYVLYLSFGVTVGFAASMVYNAGFQVIPLYFDKHRSVATAMVSMGFACGLLIVSPVTQTLLEHLGWRKAMLVMAAINGIPIILGCSITPKKKIPTKIEEDTKRRPREHTDYECHNFLRSLDLSVFKDLTFVILTLSMIVAVMGNYMPYMHLVKYAEDHGIPGHRSSWMYVTIGATSLTSRLLIGKLCDTGWIPLLRIFQCGTIILAIPNCLLPFAKNFTLLILYSVTFAIGEGMYTTPMYCLINNSYAGMGFGWFVFIQVISFFVGPTLAGFIADVSGSYHLAFYTAGGILVLSACLPELLRCIKAQTKAENKCIEREELVVVFERETVC